MNGIKMVARAFNVARKVHKGQKDKAGVPYVLHPVAVAFKCRGAVRKTVALLHEVSNETPVKESDLATLGFPSEVTEAVIAIKKGEKESIEQYIARLSANEVALDVKIQEARHNLKRSHYYVKVYQNRADQGKMERRVLKYTKLIKKLLEVKSTTVSHA